MRWWSDTLFKRLFALMWLALVVSHVVAFLAVTHGPGFDDAMRPGLPTFPSLPPFLPSARDPAAAREAKRPVRAGEFDRRHHAPGDADGVPPFGAPPVRDGGQPPGASAMPACRPAWCCSTTASASRSSASPPGLGARRCDP